MLAAFLLGFFLAAAIFWTLGTAYGVKREQERVEHLAWRRIRTERTAP
jgi:hypothetical protein